jgi:D-cysteine desulfhydrase
MAAPSDLPRLSLVHGPTPVVKHRSLDELLDIDLWIKRDDATGGAESGNKVRKLEFLLADAIARRCDTVITCGGLQSNHARATALACAALGLSCLLHLRVDGRSHAPGAGLLHPAPRDDSASSASLPLSGNVLLDRLAGARVRLISREDYAQRAAVMGAAATELRVAGRRPYIVPEGGSNGLGALGYVDAMRETASQMRAGLAGGPLPFAVVVHACGSGGTAAGVTLGAARFGVAERVRAMAVCDDATYFERAVARIVAEARAWDPSLGDPAPLVVDDAARGPGYGVSTREQRETIVRVARASGIVLDPVYTGKAMHGLAAAIGRGDVARGSRVLFLHTGGLPGLLADGDSFRDELA